MGQAISSTVVFGVFFPPFGTFASTFNFGPIKNTSPTQENPQKPISKISSLGNVNTVLLSPETNTEMIATTSGLQVSGRGKQEQLDN